MALHSHALEDTLAVCPPLVTPIDFTPASMSTWREIVVSAIKSGMVTRTLSRPTAESGGCPAHIVPSAGLGGSSATRSPSGSNSAFANASNVSGSIGMSRRAEKVRVSSS